MPLVVDQSEGGSIVRVVGSMHRADAEESRSLLLDALATGQTVEVCLSPGADLDIVALQLLIAADKQATLAGSRYRYDAESAFAVAAAIRGVGLESTADEGAAR